MGLNIFCNIRRWHLKAALVPDPFKNLLLVFLFSDKFYQFYKELIEAKVLNLKHGTYKKPPRSAFAFSYHFSADMLPGTPYLFFLSFWHEVRISLQ